MEKTFINHREDSQDLKVKTQIFSAAGIMCRDDRLD